MCHFNLVVEELLHLDCKSILLLYSKTVRNPSHGTGRPAKDAKSALISWTKVEALSGRLLQGEGGPRSGGRGLEVWAVDLGGRMKDCFEGQSFFHCGRASGLLY